MSFRGCFVGRVGFLIILSLLATLETASGKPSPPIQAGGNFVPGTFRGLIQAPSYNDESYGLFTFTLTSSGTFSGRFTYGKNSYPLQGRFNPDGSYRYEGPDYNTHLARPRFIDLQLQPADGSGGITGNITDLTHDATLSGERTRTYSVSNPAPGAGTYTFWSRAAYSENAPRGSGFGRVTMDASGRITVSGTTADGTPFSQGTTVANGGRWLLYARLHGIAGVISGEMTFRISPESDFDGSITWLGTEVPFENEVVKAYVNNFVVQVDVIGSFYRNVNGNSILRVGAQAPNAQLTFSGGAIDSPVYKSINLSSRNQASFVPRASGDGMSVTPNLGFFSGSFSSDGRTGRFRGAFLQKLNMGVGYFSEAGQYGDVGLEAR